MRKDIIHRLRTAQFIIHAQNSHLFIRAQHTHTQRPHIHSAPPTSPSLPQISVQIMTRKKNRRFAGPGSNHFRCYRLARESGQVDDIDTPSEREKELGGENSKGLGKQRGKVKIDFLQIRLIWRHLSRPKVELTQTRIRRCGHSFAKILTDPSVEPSACLSRVIFKWRCSNDDKIWHGPRDSQGQLKNDIKISVRRSVCPSMTKMKGNDDRVVASYEPRGSCFFTTQYRLPHPFSLCCPPLSSVLLSSVVVCVVVTVIVVVVVVVVKLMFVLIDDMNLLFWICC